MKRAVSTPVVAISVLIIIILCLLISGLFVSKRTQAATELVPECWCCVDGKVIKTSNPADCTRVGGTCYATQEAAMVACQPPPPVAGWCCRNGQISITSSAECSGAGGTFYTSQAAASAGCQPVGWCCKDGKVYNATSSQCVQTGGGFFTNPNDALTACRKAPAQVVAYCCVDGEVFAVTSLDECKNGKSFNTLQEAQDYCRQAQCYCCANNQIAIVPNEAKCKEMGGSSFATLDEAEKVCSKAIGGNGVLPSKTPPGEQVTVPGTTITTPPTSSESGPLSPWPPPWWVWVIVGVIIVGVAGLGFYLWLKRRTKRMVIDFVAKNRSALKKVIEKLKDPEECGEYIKEPMAYLQRNKVDIHKLGPLQLMTDT